MNVDFSRAHDCFFGSPSEPIDISKFIDEAAAVTRFAPEDVLKHSGWQVLSDDERAAVQGECSGGYVCLLFSWDLSHFEQGGRIERDHREHMG